MLKLNVDSRYVTYNIIMGTNLAKNESFFCKKIQLILCS